MKKCVKFSNPMDAANTESYRVEDRQPVMAAEDVDQPVQDRDRRGTAMADHVRRHRPLVVSRVVTLDGAQR